MRTVTVQPGQTINLGYQYDNESTQVVFPNSIISQFTDAFGTSGTFAIWYRRSGDTLGYPIGSPLVVYAGGKVTWTITEADVANPGSAQVQLRYVVGDVDVMSQVYSAIVSDSVDIGSDIPEPMEAWADAIVEAASHTANLSGLLDVDLDDPQDGQVLTYDYTAGKWTNEDPTGGDSLPEVDASDNGDVLTVVNGQWDKATPSGGGVTVDSAMSSSSTNPVQNKVIYTALQNKADSSAVPSAYTLTPSALGTASAGSSTAYAKGDHVHAMPTAADVGAIAAPQSASSGQFLVYNGSAWVAMSLSTWQGGSY